MSIITIVGAGMMGSAMATPAFDRGHTVRLAGTPLDTEIIEKARHNGYHITLKELLPPGTELYTADQLPQALQGADLVIGGVSSFGADWFADTVLPLLPDGTRVLSVTKGLTTEENGNLLPLPVAMARRYPRLSLNAIGGPCISFELAKRHETCVSFCGPDLKTVSAIADMLSTAYYHITPTTDIAGVEGMVAMKNAYALGVSLAVGLANRDGGELQYNPQAGLFAQATREMSRILAQMGGQPEQLSLGAGDLFVTVFGGRTRRIGTLLGEGKTYSQAAELLAGVTLESVAITRVVMDAFRRQGAPLSDFPLLAHIERLLQDEQPPIPWERFR